MKRYILSITLFLLATVSLQAQAAPDAAELTRLLNEFLGGVSNPAVHDRFWADDLIYTRSAGVRTNKEEIMKGLRSAPAAKPGDSVTVYTAEDIRIQQYGDAAVVAFKLVGNTTKTDGTKSVTNNLNTGTFIKRKGKWQVVAWQSTIVPEPKPAGQTSSTETKPAPLVSTPSTPSTAGSRVYLKGSRGGCYYLNASGNKTYVSKDLCK
ncbi:MAG: nuclear transport factor 2 family protein [Pyrinomonadaceae bacterium]